MYLLFNKNLRNMLDLKFVRDNIELVRQNIINKNESADVTEIPRLDEKRRSVIQEVERLKSLRILYYYMTIYENLNVWL